MGVTIILLVIFIHFVSDFILQSDWQAKNKSSDNKALTDHVFTYSLMWFAFWFGYSIVDHSYAMLWFAPITFVCHWCTDYYTSRINTALWKRGKVHEFFVCVGFDQFLHYVQLFLTYKMLTSIQ